MSYKKVSVISVTLCMALAAVSLSACGTQSPAANESLALNEASNIADASGKNNVSSADTLNFGEMFTDRDKEIGYDENNCTKISLSENAATYSDGSVEAEGDVIKISKEGVYLISGKLSDGQIVIDADNAKVQLVLDNVNINNRTGAAIYVKNADKVFVTLADDSSNVLSTSDEFANMDENNVDAVIFSKSDITFNGTGALSVNAAYGHGIVSKDDLKVTGGVYNITASSSCLSGKDSVRISDGSFTLNAGKDGIHSENADDEEKGFIYISGGKLNITADSDALDGSGTVQIDGGKLVIASADDAIHSEADLIINDGEILITKSYEGLEGEKITINGGSIDLTASDDGINAAGGNTVNVAANGEYNGRDRYIEKDRQNRNDGWDENNKMPGGMNSFSADDNCALTINGGIIKVNANGDGIDSNGSLIINGGEIYVSGPTNSGNGALDYNGSAVINGGVLAAVGASGMAQNFGADSTQGSILMNFNTSMQAGTEVLLRDSDGNILVSYTAEKSFNSVVISCPEIKDGESYTISAGENETTITMDGLIYGSGMEGGFGGHGGFGKDDDFGGHGGFGKDDDFGGRGGMKGDRPEGMPEIPEGGRPEGNMEMPEGERPEKKPAYNNI